MTGASADPARPSDSGALRQDGNGGPTLYRLDSNQSSTSVFEDVEMAHDEVSLRCKLRGALFLA